MRLVLAKNVKQVKSFLGMTGYYRKFIDRYSDIAKPMYNLTKKDAKFTWSEQCDQAFKTLKDKLTSDTVLAYPDFSKKFIRVGVV